MCGFVSYIPSCTYPTIWVNYELTIFSDLGRIFPKVRVYIWLICSIIIKVGIKWLIRPHPSPNGTLLAIILACGWLSVRNRCSPQIGVANSIYHIMVDKFTSRHYLSRPMICIEHWFEPEISLSSQSRPVVLQSNPNWWCYCRHLTFKSETFPCKMEPGNCIWATLFDSIYDSSRRGIMYRFPLYWRSNSRPMMSCLQRISNDLGVVSFAKIYKNIHLVLHCISYTFACNK